MGTTPIFAITEHEKNGVRRVAFSMDLKALLASVSAVVASSL